MPHASPWLTALQCSVIRFFLSGTRRIGALLYIECIHQFRVPRGVASLPFVISFLLIFLTGPLVGFLGGRFKLRSVITSGCILSAIGIGANFWAKDIIAVTLFWGILFGSGISIGSSLLPEVLNRSFEKNLSTANGITYAGSSIGAAVLPVVTRFLIQNYGVSGTFLILGGLVLNTLPAALLIAEEPEPKNISILEVKKEITFDISGSTSGQSSSQSGCRAFRIFLDFTYLAILINQSIFIGIMAIMNTIIVDYSMDKSVTNDQGVCILVGLAATDILGRLALGWVSDCKFVTVVAFVGTCFVALALNFLLFVVSDGFLMCMLSSSVFGLVTGGIMSHSPAIIKQYIEKEYRAMAIASRYLLFAPLILSMPSILGYFRDSVGSYDGLMYILVIMSVISSTMTYSIPYLAKRRQLQNKDIDPNWKENHS